MTRRKPRVRSVEAWADVGSHGGIFEFVVGPVAERYPNLMHIYSKPAPELVRVRISPIPKRKRRG